MDDRDNDKKLHLVDPKTSQMVTLDQIKSLYIASGMTPHEIAVTTHLPVSTIKDLIDQHKLPDLRKAYIREGLQKIQNKQLTQAQKLMDIEVNFKKLRIEQLEKELEEFLAYYARYGDFCKRHPITGEVLKDSNGIAMQIKIPNVTREINQLKESVTLSEGMKSILLQIDQILNTSNNDIPVEPTDSEDAIDVDYSSLFESSDK